MFETPTILAGQDVRHCHNNKYIVVDNASKVLKIILINWFSFLLVINTHDHNNNNNNDYHMKNAIKIMIMIMKNNMIIRKLGGL